MAKAKKAAAAVKKPAGKKLEKDLLKEIQSDESKTMDQLQEYSSATIGATKDGSAVQCAKDESKVVTE